MLPAKAPVGIKKDIKLMESQKSPISDQSSDTYISEIIREKAFLVLRKELPYTVSVEVKEINDKGNIIVIKANLLTTDKRYKKKMIIGKKAYTIKLIGQKARRELELVSQRKIYLELTVISDPHWPERFV